MITGGGLIPVGTRVPDRTQIDMNELGASDTSLWAAAAAGDSAAFGTIFDRHVRAVYNHCFRSTGDWAVAEDLTSVVFLEAWRRRTEVVPEHDSALPWLLGIATNVARNRARSVRRHRAALARLPAPLLEPDPADDITGRIDDEQTMRGILRRIAKLPRTDQDVLALCVWAGLSYADTAVALGIPVGTVRSRLHRARARLREPGPDVDGGYGQRRSGLMREPVEETS